jgi:hypothetical protein
MRAIVVLILLFWLPACARPDHAEAWPHYYTISAGPQPGYAIKQVIEKRKPATLLGDDGSVCRTSPERFAATSPGKWIGCDWKLPL